REFDETLVTYEKDITDPIGEPYEVYLACRDQIEQGIASMLKFLDQTMRGAVPAGAVRKSERVVIGSDHRGYELKEALKEYLKHRGTQVTDLGTDSQDSSDYPEFAQAVA